MTEKQRSNGVVLALNGEFNESQRDRLKAAFDGVLDEPLVVLDVTKTANIDSSVLGSLLRLRGELLQRGGALIVAGPTVMIQRLLEITCLTELFDVRPALAETDTAAGLRRVELVSDET